MCIRDSCKKYHPDSSNPADSREKFIKISEAYNFLLDVGPAPHREKVQYDYDPVVAEYDLRRQKARKRAKEMVKEREASSQHIDTFLKVSNWVFLVLMSAFVLDLALPSIPSSVEVLRTGRHTEYHPGGQYSSGSMKTSRARYKVYTSEGTILLAYPNADGIAEGDEGVLRKTLFYRLSTSFTRNSTEKRYPVSNPLFSYLLVFPLTAFISSVVALRTKKQATLWNFGTMGFILVPIFFFIINWYS